ncbi:hypothetical protein M2132_001811 [Dysgonomonas sp. PH5-45]|uniref:hypothetical protein n=1 Tax=unclassified Dysgonomonas TaxID=2630389 RepID=UPI0024730A33|nr:MULTISPECIES: hypothetical protein [unclassified Dysgonomonas]MDH6355468.1 hypothetical protein [Dysgonomonas sp. PH5-45]MDH6388364.1 hypothetical protein [Dysgonomonas sp. PH5-37]
MGKKNGITTTTGYQVKKSLEEQKYDVILAHILNPDNSPLPDEYRQQFDRIKYAAVALDEYHPSNVIPRLLIKYNITRNQARNDIKLAQELFKSKHTFDFDFWQQWQIKDLVDVIRTCKLANGKLEKERVAAHKVLKSIIGDKPTGEEDPRRMEKNIFYIQLNNNNTTVNIPMDKLKGLSQEEVQTVVAAMTTPEIEDSEIIELLNT